MSSHSMTLPGIAAPSNRWRECWGDDCLGLIPRNSGTDTIKAWNSALENGPHAIAEYLRQHNKVKHDPGCDFQVLPPSVHNAAMDGGRDPRPVLKQALTELNEARRTD